jgi:hypothetical protein
MAFDTNGLVTIEGAKGTAGGRAVAAAFLTPTPTQWSFASLVENLLAQLENAAGIAIDTVARKVYFTDDLTQLQTLRGVATNGDDGHIGIFSPDPGQTGRSLTWALESVDDGPTNETELTALVASTPPKKTVSSLVSSILTAKDAEGNPITPPKVIFIDQHAVNVITVDDDRSTALAAATINAGNAGVLTLTEPTAEGEVAPLPFEGGEIS